MERREFRLNGIVPRYFVKDADGFLQSRVAVEAVSVKDGRRMAASNLSFDAVWDFISRTVDSRLNSGCVPDEGILAGQNSNFLFTEQDMQSLGLA